MASGFLDKLFGGKKKKDEGKKKKAEKPSPDNEFAEDEKTFDGVVRQLKSDLYKDTLVGSRKQKEKKK